MPVTDLTEEEEKELALQRRESDETTKPMSIVPPEISHQPGFAGRRSTPSPMMKGLSTALMQGAFEKFGSAFTATGDVARDRASDAQRMAPFREAGATVASRLEDRWFRMEYENFQKNEVEPYIQAKRQMLEDYQNLNNMLNDGRYPGGAEGEFEQFDLSTPEGRAQALRARTSLFQKFYQTNADMDMQLAEQAYKYPHNPIIDRRIQAIVEAGQKGLMQTAAPREVLEAEGRAAEIRQGDERNRINQQLADAQTSQARTAAKQTQTVAEYLKDPNGGGVTDVLQQMETGRLQHVLTSPAAAAYLDQGRAILREQLHRRNQAEAEAAGEEYDRSDPVAIAEVEEMIERNGGAVQRAGAVALLRSVNPAAAKEARKHAPQFYELIPEEGLPGTPASTMQRPVPTTRITKKQQRKNVSKWQKPVAEKLKEYMADPNNDPNIDAAISHIVDEWLPEAIAGRASSHAPQGILASEDAVFDEYRERVREEMRAYLKKNFWRISDVAAEENPEAARQARPRRRGPGRGIGLLIDKGVEALFD